MEPNLQNEPTQPIPQPIQLTHKSFPFKWPLIIIGAILILILIGGAYFLETKKNEPQITQVVPSLSPTPVDKSTIAFVDNSNKLMLLKGIRSTPVQIAKATSAEISPDGKKLAYVFIGDPKIHVLDLSSGKTESIETEYSTLRMVFWSPNGRYLISETGSDVVGSQEVFLYPEGKLITFYATDSTVGRPIWIDQTSFIFPDPQTVHPSRPYGNGEGMGITKVNLSSGEKQILLQANGLTDYYSLTVDNGSIYFVKNTATNQADWLNNNNNVVQTTYWKMNSDGTGKVQVQKSQIPPDTTRSIILSNLPPKFSGYRFFNSAVVNPLFKNWIIFELDSNVNASVSNAAICIMDLNNPKNSFRQIATGVYPSW
jgi:hypothetical protein